MQKKRLTRSMLMQPVAILTSVLLFGALPTPVLAHDAASTNQPRQTYRAYFKQIELARAIAHSRFETLESQYELGYVIVNANPDEARELRALGFRLQTDTQWQARQAALVQQNRKAATTLAGIPGYSCYPTVEEVYSQAQQWASSKPQLASWLTVGQSWEKKQGLGGYDLKVLKLTNNAIAGDKPKLFIQAGIHAREYTTTPLALAFAKKLVDGHGVDADLTWILDHHEVHLLLVANPDGRKQAESGKLWRKNTNRNYCGATSDSRGADLNRNFSYAWNSTSGGSSGSVCNETYRGPTAGSEPEVQTIQNYIASLWPDRRGPNRNDPAPLDTSGIHLDIHSHSRLILWPWGTKGTPAANDAQLATLGRKFAYWNGYTPQRSLGLYETDGTSDGPSYGERGVPAYTFELGTAFFESCSNYTNTIVPGNLPALIYAAKVVRSPYQTPAGPEALNPSLTKSGTLATLKATLDDTRFSNSNGTEPTQTIAAAEYYIDTPPWQAGAVAHAMTASDGAFNSAVEAAQASIDLSNVSPGKHIVYVRGKDSAGNWGVISAIYLNTGVGTPPVATFNASVNGMQVSLTDQSTDDGSINTRHWDLGDGNSSNVANPSHTYFAGGSYNVNLQVIDNDGLSGNTSKTITISDDGVEKLANKQTVSPIGLAQGSWRYFKLALPAGAKNLAVSTSGGSGDLDLFTRYGLKPSSTSFECKKDGGTNAESCTSATPKAGVLYIGVYGYKASTGVSLKVSFTQ